MMSFSADSSDSSLTVFRSKLSAKKASNINGFTLMLTLLTVLSTSQPI
jgi:hypothetical protein